MKEAEQTILVLDHAQADDVAREIDTILKAGWVVKMVSSCAASYSEKVWVRHVFILEREKK